VGDAIGTWANAVGGGRSSEQLFLVVVGEAG